MDIGPLLGKGSYGRVYKGRWKGAMVAIKVLDHALILQDDISRETLLSTSIAHPCVVRAARRGASMSSPSEAWKPTAQPPRPRVCCPGFSAISRIVVYKPLQHDSATSHTNSVSSAALTVLSAPGMPLFRLR